MVVTKSKTTRATLPKFLSPHELHKRPQNRRLKESEMEVVATIPLPRSPLNANNRKKKLVIKCEVTADELVCTYRWV